MAKRIVFRTERENRERKSRISARLIQRKTKARTRAIKNETGRMELFNRLIANIQKHTAELNGIRDLAQNKSVSLSTFAKIEKNGNNLRLALEQDLADARAVLRHYNDWNVAGNFPPERAQDFDALQTLIKELRSNLVVVEFAENEARALLGKKPLLPEQNER
ncbi:MAG: hypothetical protein V1777_03365 [Candidatus Micrarchaeota archaeon]